MRCGNNFLSDVYKFLKCGAGTGSMLMQCDTFCLFLCAHTCASPKMFCAREVLALIISLLRLRLKLWSCKSCSIIALFSALFTCVVVVVAIHGLLPTAMTSKKLWFFPAHIVWRKLFYYNFSELFSLSLGTWIQNKTRTTECRTKQTLND